MRTGRRDFARLSFLAGAGASLPLGCVSSGADVGAGAGASGLPVGLAASPRDFDVRGRSWSLLPNEGALEVHDAGARLLRVDALARPVAVAVHDDVAWVIELGAFERGVSGLARIDLAGRVTRHGGEVLVGPRDVALDADGSVLVADSLAHRIHRFDPEGAHVGSMGEPGPREGQLNGPRALAVDADTWLVAEIGGRRVTRLDRSGAWLETVQLESLDLESTLLLNDAPTLVAPRALRVGPDGLVAVADLVADQVFLVGRDGSHAHFAPDVRPEGLAFAPDGTLWVCGAARG